MLSSTRKLWLDHDVVARVKPVTLRRYQAAMVTFASWALQENLTAGWTDDLDDALMWYKQSERPTRSQFIVMVSALEFCVPAAKGHLYWSLAAFGGWSKRARILCAEIRETGRWQSDSSLRCYLDIVVAAEVVKTMRMTGRAGRLVAAERVWPYSWQ